jgi:hypothetical protein
MIGRYDSLKEFTEAARRRSNSRINSPSVMNRRLRRVLRRNYLEKLILYTNECTQIRHENLPDISKFLLESNLLYCGYTNTDDNWTKVALSIGADPEFILCDKKDKDKIVLFSSEHISNSNGIGVSELALGADYGLMEIRPNHVESSSLNIDTGLLIKNIKSLIKQFKTSNAGKMYEIKEAEAVEFDHKRQRTLELIRDSSLDFGGTYNDKESQLADATSMEDGDLGMMLESCYGASISAYGDPILVQGDDRILTAGGHIHIGGWRIQILSFDQLKALVREIDKVVLPIERKIETPAAELRRKFYGRPGEFRLKPYGIEYRSPSCALFWEENLPRLKEALDEIVLVVEDFTGK